MSYNINNPPADKPSGLVVQQDKQEDRIEITIPSTEESLQKIIDAVQGYVDARTENDENKKIKDAISADVNKPKTQQDK